MHVRLKLISHAATAAMRRAAFPGDEPLDEKGRRAAEAMAGRFAGHDLVLASPALRARQTAAAFGLDARDDPNLRDCDYGRWQGRAINELAEADPAVIKLWQEDLSAAPHGGESIDALIRRVGHWLDHDVTNGDVVAITHASVIRAAVVHVVGATAASFWRIDVAPLSIVDFTRNDRGWSLRAARL